MPPAPLSYLHQTGVLQLPEEIPHLTDPDAYAVRLRGSCMAPLVRDGSMALCSPNEPLQEGALVVVVLGDGVGLLKRLFRLPLVQIVRARGAFHAGPGGREQINLCSEFVELETINPSAVLRIRVDRIRRMDAVVHVIPPGAWEDRVRPVPGLVGGEG